MNVTLIDYNLNGMESIVEAVGICRGNVCSEKTIDHCLNAKPVPHMSVLEFGWAMVKVEGVSVKCRLQEVRHRLFSTLERSTRALNMSGEEVVIPETVKHKEAFSRGVSNAMMEYELALARGESLEDAAYLLPIGITTKFYLAGNIRTWFEYFEKRLCKHDVQDEHYRLAVMMFNILKEKFPIITKASPCVMCGKCMEVSSNYCMRLNISE